MTAQRVADELYVQHADAFPPPDREFDPLRDSDAGQHLIARYRAALAVPPDDDHQIIREFHGRIQHRKAGKE